MRVRTTVVNYHQLDSAGNYYPFNSYFEWEASVALTTEFYRTSKVSTVGETRSSLWSKFSMQDNVLACNKYLLDSWKKSLESCWWWLDGFCVRTMGEICCDWTTFFESFGARELPTSKANWWVIVSELLRFVWSSYWTGVKQITTRRHTSTCTKQRLSF